MDQRHFCYDLFFKQRCIQHIVQVTYSLIMAIHIIIDGYNLIRQSRQLSEIDVQDLQMGREALIHMLVAYKRLKGHRITVVFDGIDAPCRHNLRDRIEGIEIKFSRSGESADAVIKRMVAGAREKALIVSSDREIISHSESHGATTVGSAEFEEKVKMAMAFESNGFDMKKDLDGWRPTTKKKGPRKRLSRKERRAKTKIDKL
jgi:predicted RNA-binding protein with PIN domain